MEPYQYLRRNHIRELESDGYLLWYYWKEPLNQSILWFTLSFGRKGGNGGTLNKYLEESRKPKTDYPAPLNTNGKHRR